MRQHHNLVWVLNKLINSPLWQAPAENNSQRCMFMSSFYRTENSEMTAELQKTYSYPHYISVLSRNLEGSNPTTLLKIALNGRKCLRHKQVITIIHSNQTCTTFTAISIDFVKYCFTKLDTSFTVIITEHNWPYYDGIFLEAIYNLR